MSKGKSELTGYLYVSIASLIWSSNGVIVNMVSLDALTIAFFRVIFASLALSPIVLFIQKNELLRITKAWKNIVALGACLGLGWTLLFQSMKLITIASAVLLNYVAPVFVALFSPLILREKIERTTIIALLLCIMGMIVISYEQGLGSLNAPGVILGLLAGLSYAGFIVMSKIMVTNYSGITIAFCSYLTCIIFLLPFAFTNMSSPYSQSSWFLIVMLGVFNTAFAVTIYLKGLSMVKAQKAIIFTYLEPAGAVLFGYLFLLQKPTFLTIIGGILILSAVYLTASKK